MSGDDLFEEINEAKAEMDHIYNQPDPRAYFSELRKLGYRIPGTAKPVFEKLIARLRRARHDTVHVLDLGCSYGVNGALLKHDMTMSELYDHWDQDDLSDATPEEVADYDRRFFSNQEEHRDIEVIGLDPAGKAVAFAERAGLIDEGIAANLETQPVPDPVKPDLAAVDLVTSTGCVGYVTEKSFERLLPAITEGQAPWLANFVLRLFPFDPIEQTLSEWGYVTEKLEGRTFVQRRFASDDEQTQVLAQLHDQGIDPTGKEADGYLHAEFYLSRPAEDARKAPLDTLLPA